MAKNTAIKHIKSSVSGNVPVYTGLEYGELAINYNDGALYFRDSADNVRVLGSTNNNLLTGEYIFSTSTSATDPGSGVVRLNNGTRSSVTAIYIDQLSNLKTDGDPIFKSLVAGDVIVWQDKATAANTVRYRVTSAPTNNTGWWSIPVEWMSETGSLWTASTLLSFTLHRIGTIGTNGLANDAVSFAKMQNSAAAGLSVVGRSTNSAGDFAEINAGTDGHVIRRSGTSVGFGTILPAAVVGATTSKGARFNGSGVLVAHTADIPTYPADHGFGAPQLFNWSGPGGNTWTDLFSAGHSNVTLGIGWHEVICQFFMTRTAGATGASLEYRWISASSSIDYFSLFYETYTNLTSTSPPTTGYTLDSSGVNRSIAVPGGATISTSIADGSMTYKVYLRQLAHVTIADNFTPQIRFSGAIGATTTIQWGSYWTHRSFSSQGGIA